MPLSADPSPPPLKLKSLNPYLLVSLLVNVEELANVWVLFVKARSLILSVLLFGLSKAVNLTMKTYVFGWQKKKSDFENRS